MADKDKKDAGGGGTDMTSEIVVMLIVIFLAWVAYERISYYLSQHGLTMGQFFDIIGAYLRYYLWPIIKVLAAIISFAAVVGITYNYYKLRDINLEEEKIYRSPDVKVEGERGDKNEKWERIIELINSPNTSDWRLAIIESDIMLEDFMRKAGYHGDSLGEMLKSVEKSDFTSIDAAWEAHKVRNAIAHQGENFQLNEREAKHAISLFESVFKEFNII